MNLYKYLTWYRICSISFVPLWLNQNGALSHTSLHAGRTENRLRVFILKVGTYCSGILISSIENVSASSSSPTIDLLVAPPVNIAHEMEYTVYIVHFLDEENINMFQYYSDMNQCSG